MSKIILENVRPNILVTHSDVSEAAINLLKEKCNVRICKGYPSPTREEILKEAHGMDGILWATHDQLNAEALDRIGPQLKSISTKSSGVDYVDINEVKRRGIPLGNTPKILNDAVADIAIGLMIAAARRFNEGKMKIENSEWEFRPWFLLGKDIKSSTIGIVGFGGIGQTIAKRLLGFDVEKILYCGHNRKLEDKKLNAEFVTFNKILEESDFIFVSAPLTDETKNMFNDETFKKMKNGCVFINVARGGLVDQNALIKALKNGNIFAAGLDVMTPEPLPSNHELLKLPNCVIIPHLGSATERTEDDMAMLAAKNVLLGLEGKPMLASV